MSLEKEVEKKIIGQATTTVLVIDWTGDHLSRASNLPAAMFGPSH